MKKPRNRIGVFYTTLATLVLATAASFLFYTYTPKATKPVIQKYDQIKKRNLKEEAADANDFLGRGQFFSFLAEYELFLNSGEDLQQLKSFLHSIDGTPLSKRIKNWQNYAFFRATQIDVHTMNQFLAVKNQRGYNFFHGMKGIDELLDRGGTLHDIDWLRTNLHSYDSLDKVFKAGQKLPDFKELWNVLKAANADQILQKTKHPQRVFRLDMHPPKVSPLEAYVQNFIFYNGSIDMAKNFLDNNMSAHELLYASMLGLDYEHANAADPDIVLIYPTVDHNRASYSKSEMKLKKQVLTHFPNGRIRVADNEDTALSAVSENAVSPKLVWFTIHGLPGKSYLSKEGDNDEHYRLDKRDWRKFRTHFSNLKEGSYIVLETCYGGTDTGFIFKKRLAQKMSKAAPQCYVFAPNTLMQAGRYELSFDPFYMRIYEPIVFPEIMMYMFTDAPIPDKGDITRVYKAGKDITKDYRATVLQNRQNKQKNKI